MNLFPRQFNTPSEIICQIVLTDSLISVAWRIVTCPFSIMKLPNGLPPADDEWNHLRGLMIKMQLRLAFFSRMTRKNLTTMAKYGKTAQRKVKKAMHERKSGTLKSGRSGKKVTSRKQAIAIGLSEARKRGAKVPSKKTGRSRKTGRKTAKKTRSKS